MPVRVPVEPAVVRWAIERSGRPEADLARAVTATTPWWQLADGQPTFAQAQKFAHAARVPLGYLFLAEPPEEGLPIPDFRRGPDHDALDVDLLDTITIAQNRQSWFREYLEEIGAERVALVGRYTSDDDADDAAAQIRADLNLDEVPRSSSDDEFLRRLIRRVEDVGVVVVRSGVVGTNTSRPLNPQSFHGFSLVDPLAPIVFVNTNDAKSAQSFTVAHELAHITIAREGVSRPAPGEDVGIEQWCNSFAGALLVPEATLREAFDPPEPLAATVQELRRRFRVSGLVILIRLADCGLIGRAEFRIGYREELERLRVIAADKASREKTRSGGQFYNTAMASLSRRFARAVIADTRAGRTLYRDAYGLLGLRSQTTFDELERHLEA